MWSDKYMFKKRTKKPLQPYDPTTQKPVLKCSICTGEQVAGLKDIRSGKFHEVMLIRNDRDLQTFFQMYGITDITKEY